MPSRDLMPRDTFGTPLPVARRGVPDLSFALLEWVAANGGLAGISQPLFLKEALESIEKVFDGFGRAGDS